MGNTMRIKLIVFLFVVFTAAPLLGQRRGDDRGRWGPPRSDEQSLERYQSYLNAMDTNHNGQIDANEAEGGRGYMVRRLAERANVEAKFPLSISQVRDGLNKSVEKPEEKKKEESGTPLVPGFGEPQEELPPLVKFGERPPIKKAAPEKPKEKPRHSHETEEDKKPHPSPTPEPRTYRFRSAIERLPEGIPEWFIQKDANGDCQVSMSEYSSNWTLSLVDQFRKYDLNQDGLITPIECLKGEDKPESVQPVTPKEAAKPKAKEGSISGGAWDGW